LNVRNKFEILLVLYHLYVIIRDFYKYASNRYLRHILNNFVCEELYEWFLYVHQCQSRRNVMCFYLLKYKWVTRMNPNPNFSNWVIQIIYFVLFNFLQIHDTTNLLNKLLHIFSYLVNIILEILEMFLLGLISILRDKLILLTWYTCHKIVIIGEVIP